MRGPGCPDGSLGGPNGRRCTTKPVDYPTRFSRCGQHWVSPTAGKWCRLCRISMYFHILMFRRFKHSKIYVTIGYFVRSLPRASPTRALEKKIGILTSPSFMRISRSVRGSMHGTWCPSCWLDRNPMWSSTLMDLVLDMLDSELSSKYCAHAMGKWSDDGEG